MKLLITFISAAILSSCSDTQPSTPATHVVLINDVTDSMLVRVDQHSLLQRFNLSLNKSAKVMFTYSEISDLRLSKTVSITLPSESETNQQNSSSTPFFRQQKILAFFDTIRNLLISGKYENQTKGNSECFLTISKQLHFLAETESREKLMIITSDLQENSSILSVYDKRFSKVTGDKIDSIFEHTKLLPANLRGITVIIIYQPVDRSDDLRFALMSEVYNRLLSKRGAHVIVQSDNKNLNNELSNSL